MSLGSTKYIIVALALALATWDPGVVLHAVAQPARNRVLAGTIVDEQGNRVDGAVVTVHVGQRQLQGHSDEKGNFRLIVPEGAVVLTVSGRFIGRNEQKIGSDEEVSNLRIPIHYVLPTAQETLVITAQAADPSIDRRNDSVYQNTLFNRDDQLLETLDSGINAGQHEGGGKSLEIRRYGFNLDHGGANGGIKILVDDVPQNQGTQGHGQGYLGALKSISPELVQDIDLMNGPFHAEYGDFSALGVIHIRQKERMENTWTARAQGGSFDAWRSFVAWSPRVQSLDTFLAWEHAFTNGPFLNPLHYTRDNLTANLTHSFADGQSLGLRLNGGRNDFDSSGQIPLDQVKTGRMDRFGYMDPSDGGNVRSGGGSAYYKKNLNAASTLRADGFVNRILFDLFSNFTFYKNWSDHPGYGDGIQQHDSRLQEGASLQYMRGDSYHRQPTLLVSGANLSDIWINVDLFHQQNRKIFADWTQNNVHIINQAVYAQQSIDLPHVHLEGGLRFDDYRYSVLDRLTSNQKILSAAFLEPKANLIYTPSRQIPVSLHMNYGRAVTSLDARSILQNPSAPVASATDFYMAGSSHHLRRLSASTDVFLIDRQHELVYDADDGSYEEQGPSRSYGWEVKSSLTLNHHLSWNGGITQVSNAFYRGTKPREYVDSAPHSVANASVTLQNWHSLYSSVRYRHISGYSVFNIGSTALPAYPYTSATRAYANGLDVVDFSVSAKMSHGVEWNLSVDNLNQKKYYETQNLFDSRLTPDAQVEARIHGTPGYPQGITAGFTWRFE